MIFLVQFLPILAFSARITRDQWYRLHTTFYGNVIHTKKLPVKIYSRWLYWYLDTHVTRGNVYERVSNGDLATCKTGLHWKTPSVHWVSVAPSGQRTIIKSKRFFDPWGDSTDLGFRYFEQLKLKFFPNGLTKEYDGYR